MNVVSDSPNCNPLAWQSSALFQDYHEYAWVINSGLLGPCFRLSLNPALQISGVAYTGLLRSFVGPSLCNPLPKAGSYPTVWLPRTGVTVMTTCSSKPVNSLHKEKTEDSFVLSYQEQLVHHSAIIFHPSPL